MAAMASKRDSSWVYRSAGGCTVSIPLVIDHHPKTLMSQRDFLTKIQCASRQERALVSLIYDMDHLAEKNKKTKISKSRYSNAIDGTPFVGSASKIAFDTKDPFCLCVIGDTVALHRMCKSNPELLHQVDEFDSTLLYKAARSGFRDTVEMLLVLQCSVDLQIHMGSTALHAAAFYGHDIVVALLLAKNADRSIKNKYRNTPVDEARNSVIRGLLKSTAIQDHLQTLEEAGVTENIRPVMVDGRIVAWKASRLPRLIRQDLLASDRPPSDWIVGWHGTQPRHLKSILKHNLQPAGGRAGGAAVNVADGHIPLETTIFGIPNFAKAVFVSPCVAYAAHPAYAGRVATPGTEWVTLIETRVRPNAFKTFRSTVGGGYKPLDGEGIDPEYRVETELPGHVGGVALEGHGSLDAVHDILRMEHGGGLTNCVVVGVCFLSKDYLDGCGLTNTELSRSLSQP